MYKKNFNFSYLCSFKEYFRLAWEPSFALKQRFLYKSQLISFKPSSEHSLGSTEFLQFEANRLRGSSIKPISSYRTYKQKSFEYLQY